MASKPKPHPDQARAWLDTLITSAAEFPFCEIVDLTPEMARHILSLNVDNRKISASLVAQIAADIREGRWQFNGESIVISKDGKLNDGQHRLEGIRESGKTVRLVLVGGVGRDSRMTLDMGRARTVDDYLTLSGVHYAHVAASAARLTIAYERSGGLNFNQARWISKPLAIERGLADPLLAEAAAWAVRSYGPVQHLITQSQLATCYYILAKIDRAAALDYMNHLATGHDLPRHSPILSVRRYLPTFTARQREPKIALVLRGWTYWRRGQSAEFGDIHGRYPLPKLD